MTNVAIYHTRPQRVRAMRIILGTTTKSEILAFCPRANVGVTLNTDLIDDETDIRWVHIPRTGMGGGAKPSEMHDDGDWLVLLPDGAFTILSDYEFNSQYEAAR